MNRSQVIAGRVLDITPGSLSDADFEQLARLIFDYAGCAYSGTAQPAGRGMRAWARTYTGAGQAGLLAAGGRVPPAIAALVNGTAGHCYELDDTHDATLSHPGAVVISAALAVAAETGSSGVDVMAAIAAGYEAMTRIGAAANPLNVIEFGFHPTALFGCFGAAAAAAKLHGLDADKLLCAWGHCLSLASGSTQFADESLGTDTKRTHAGYAAHQGVLAVEFSLNGVEAPRRAIDGKYGFIHLHGRDPRPEVLDQPAPTLAIHEISMKPYACCRQFHSAIDALRVTTADFTKVDRIKGIIIRGPRILKDQHMQMRPESSMAAQYSLPYVVGATLAYGPSRHDAFAVENLQDRGILDWADIVKVEYDEELQSVFPEHFGTEVEITFDDGSAATDRILDSRGTPALPLSWEQIAEKASSLAQDIRPGLDMDGLQSAVRGLRAAPNINALDMVLSADGAARVDAGAAD
ncbi:MAG TPA: 2-methylcitrate dehydratase [Rhodospirillaceae bacterium]|nr:2-methylcitrate dehydratase [Magnetovibrio sp.]HBT41509.1 2-methylcitrate dehydratase [Rhodospirillaceae bacterium]HCS69997.1 2-methylcitrate dehydratase [Rhodospirillaceae bacterium]|tara:strand:+ start:1195 stop:2589 length:1395 start_codon:yes stop_codon:yes gene_type:complete